MLDLALDIAGHGIDADIVGIVGGDISVNLTRKVTGDVSDGEGLVDCMMSWRMIF